MAKTKNKNADVTGGDVSVPAQQPRHNGVPPEPDPRKFSLTGKVIPNRVELLTELNRSLEYRQKHFLGYQANQDMDDYKQNMQQFLGLSLNNIGDPFVAGGYRVESRVAECAVLNYFATLWNGIEHDPKNPESCWGYGLSMGSTEGNLYAMWNARDYLAGRRLNVEPDVLKSRPVAYQEPLAIADNPNAYEPVIFYSEDTHYSFAKAGRVLNLPTFSAVGRARYRKFCPLGGDWPDEVPSECPPSESKKDDQYPSFGPGSIDVDKLALLVEFFAKLGHPIVVNLNYGSTFKGAYDDVRRVCDRLLPIFEENGLVSRKVEYESGKFDTRRGFWIHVDGALGASYMPFLAKTGASIPEFDFGLKSSLKKGKVSVDMVSSIVTSGHKWLGSPVPCGVLLTKVKYQMQPPDNPAYIGSPDTTFAGSRTGFSQVVLWDRIAQSSDATRGKQIKDALQLTETMVKRMTDEVQKKWSDLDLYIERSPQAITIRFRKPSDELVRKWSLSTVSMYMRPNQQELRHYAHIFVMQFTVENKPMLDEFIKDLCKPDAFDRAAPALAANVSPFADRGFA
jgi:glutamate/tyrosine decarboxylase-like PLP-dependent enzyme